MARPASRTSLVSAYSPAQSVNQHRSGTPLRIDNSELTWLAILGSRWGPDRRRSGPHPWPDFLRNINSVWRILPGSHFGADSQTVRHAVSSAIPEWPTPARHAVSNEPTERPQSTIAGPCARPQAALCATARLMQNGACMNTLHSGL